MNSKRFLVRAEREINRDSFIQEWPETGLIVFNSPFDPKPHIRIAAGRITELDGMQESEFDIIDRFIASHAIDSGTMQSCRILCGACANPGPGSQSLAASAAAARPKSSDFFAFPTNLTQ